MCSFRSNCSTIPDSLLHATCSGVVPSDGQRRLTSMLGTANNKMTMRRSFFKHAQYSGDQPFSSRTLTSMSFTWRSLSTSFAFLAATASSSCDELSSSSVSEEMLVPNGKGCCDAGVGNDAQLLAAFSLFVFSASFPSFQLFNSLTYCCRATPAADSYFVRSDVFFHAAEISAMFIFFCGFVCRYS